VIKSSIKDFEVFLKQIGVQKKHTLLVHSDITSLGLIEKDLNGVFEAFQNVLGPEGTLIVPTFSFSFCNQKIFDPQKTPSTSGVFTNYIRTLHESKRSVHPNHSFSAIGPKKENVLKFSDKTSFGPGTVFTSMLNEDVQVLLLGTFRNSYVHYVEKNFGVSYRYDKFLTGFIANKDKKYEDTFSMYVRDINAQGTDEDDRKTQRNLFFDSPLCKSKGFGYGVHRFFRAKDYCEFFFDKLEKDPFYLINREKFEASFKKVE